MTARDETLPRGAASGGAWRVAALAFFALALAGAGSALVQPEIAQWAGVVLLAAIAGAGAIVLYAVWPRAGRNIEDIRRAAAAAAEATVAWVIVDPGGAVSDCNDAYRRLVGTAEGEAAVPPPLAFATENAAAALYRLSRASADGRAHEETLATQEGQTLDAAVRPLKEGGAAWWFAPKLAAPAPRAAAAPAASPAAPAPGAPSAVVRFSDFFHDAPVGVAITRADGAVVEANAAFAKFFAVDGRAASFGALVAQSDREDALALIARAAEGAASIEPVDIKPAAAGERSAQLYASPLAKGAEGEARAILYLVDTSEQKALETQFAQSQKMQAVGQLAGGVAHDFNNLLTVIIGNCDLLLMRHPASDPSFAEINEVHQNAVRAAGLVRQLLAFSRKQTLQPKTLALSDTISELAMLLRRLLGEKVSLKLEHGKDLWPVRADEGQIANALINLAVNARDAMPPEGGTVAIRTSNLAVEADRPIGGALMPKGDYVLIAVADTGIGIAKEHLGKIFEPFFTTKGVGQGTGLGLSTVYGIVKQTGGFITVESAVGKGTVFHIFLPRHVVAEGAMEVEETARAAPRDVTGQDTILLVEDEEAVRSFAARALRMRGYQVLEANGGETALDLVRKHHGAIDLLISDVVMPGMDGPTLVRAARRLRPEMRILFMSGYAEEAFRKNDQKAEDIDFLPKPFGLKQLAAKVKEVLSGGPPARLSDSLGETGT